MKPSAASGTSSPGHSAPRTPNAGIGALAPFLTEGGMARVSGSGTDVYSTSTNLSPTQAHNSIKRILMDHYRFTTTFDVYQFMTALGSASSANPTWSEEDGQLFLKSVASDNGLLRIGDVVRWEHISTQVGTHRSILSFQRGYLPLLKYLTSDFVVKSTLNTLINALYTQILGDFDHFVQVIEQCMDTMIAARSFKDPRSTAHHESSIGSQILASLASVFYECLTRFKNVVAMQPRMAPVVQKLRDWTEAWVQGVSAHPPTFEDPFGTSDVRTHVTSHIQSKVNRLVAIVDRERSKLDRSSGPAASARRLGGGSALSEGVIAALQSTYEGPGTERTEGPRHDNDFVEIQRIRIAPTHEELISRVRPFLPVNAYNAPHPFPSDSMEKLLDIQFRLLREELTAPIRASIQLIWDDLQASPQKKTSLSEIISKGGGKYRGQVVGQDSVMFNVYTEVAFASIVPDRRGISAGISFQTPPGRARSHSAKDRASFWEGMGGKRLMQGGLIALIWKEGANVSVHLGVLASSTREVTDSAKQTNGAERLTVRISFFDAAVELRILNSLKQRDTRSGVKILVEAPVMFEAIRPFLEALRVEPEDVPFGQYLVHRPANFFESFTIKPPAYTLSPRFRFDLACLFPPSAGVKELKLNVSDPASVEVARHELRHHSRLDISQADAVIDTLTREVSLIQGPPGTGKSYTGVELLRVLIANNVRPILMIAMTNHALDHMLCSVLDAGITTKIVRLGSRSADERISEYSIEKMEMVTGRSRLDQAFAKNHWSLKVVEDEIRKLMEKFLKTTVDSEEIVAYLRIYYPEHYEYITDEVPEWIKKIKLSEDGDGTDEGWQRAGRNGRPADAPDNSMYSFWREGRDLAFLWQAHHPDTDGTSDVMGTQETRAPSHNTFNVLAESDTKPDASADVSETDSDTSSDDDDSEEDQIAPEERWKKVSAPVAPTSSSPLQTKAPAAPTIPRNVSPIPDILHPSDLRNTADFFRDAFGLDEIPAIPSADRALDFLLENGEIWHMSLPERQRLHDRWTASARINAHDTLVGEFERLRTRHAEALQKFNEGKDEARRQLLRKVDIVGCTTTGAAKLTSLLKGLEPRVMLVEEAGQVLEAHVLGSLVRSVEHLVLVGDPLQLRPTLNNYMLSVENNRGGSLYSFDVSSMERLAKAGLPMSQINVQRRMRPAISSLIRNTLYPQLQDHDLVKQYPPVRGFTKNVFFLSHNHKESGGGEESVSKYNTYEVEMIADLVLYLLRQGCYSKEGDIVVLCAYLGQLARVRDALAGKVAVVIDERDQVELADQEAEKDDASQGSVDYVKVAQRVRLRTVDNYQGEEATIVILSLVRNSGGSKDDTDLPSRTNIGFLKSENRTNVALSRAREGLFILGNATDLSSRSQMWHSIIGELESEEAVGEGIPVACHRHPDTVQFISQPGKLPNFSPDGGCLRPCDARLKCGHICPYKCHPDDPNHIAVACVHPCRRLCERGHPCHKDCAEDCGKCQFPIRDVLLPCQHRKLIVPCHMMSSLDEIICDEVVTKKLTHCEHTARLRCSVDPATHLCQATCGSNMLCCGQQCQARCHQCQSANGTDGETGPRQRISHHPHSCRKTLYCEHQCQNPCSQDHECTTICKEPCLQVCAHAKCKSYCSTPCAPCQEPCVWNCPHYSCPVPCGSVCARLPCDRRCEKFLECGHRCPSVCGEPCASQICPSCASEDVKQNIVDFIMQRTLEDIDVEQGTLDELLITNPTCGHVFTVETLDGHCSIAEYYQQAPDGTWMGLQAPPDAYKAPPKCPNCRSAITAPRYGRVFKPANLRILENDVAGQMSHSLSQVHSTIDAVTNRDVEIQERVTAAARTITAGEPSQDKKLRKQREKCRSKALRLDISGDQPAPLDSIDPGNRLYHGAFPVGAAAWRKQVQPLFRAYQQTLAIAATRSAHVNAWQSAFSCLYSQEMELALADPAYAPRRPEEYAMRVARMKVGQPQPRADRRFLVEAFWASLNIRFTLAGYARKWLDTLSDRPTYSPHDRQIWATYIDFVLSTCVRDATAAIDVARASESHRQVVQTSLFVLRAELEKFRFNIDESRRAGALREHREELIASASQKKIRAREMKLKEQSSLEARRVFKANPDIRETFEQTSALIIEEYGKIEESLRRDTFYEPVSVEERMGIIKALNFSHTGHFYNCPNGHSFVIGECGGAMERARCPECGAAIGGANHTLEANNTRDVQMEALLRQGAERSPWAWAQ